MYTICNQSLHFIDKKLVLCDPTPVSNDQNDGATHTVSPQNADLWSFIFLYVTF